jgi:rare lipoprotein A
MGAMARIRRAYCVARAAAVAVAFALAAGVGGDADARQAPHSNASTAKSKHTTSRQVAANKVALKKSAATRTAAGGAAKKSAAKKTTTKKAMTPAQRKRAAAIARAREKARVARIIRAAGPPPPVKKHYDGVASFYTKGRRTAAGGRYNPGAMTAAHRSLPFGTKVRVTDKRNGRSVTVTINDRGPFKRGRVIDLSRAAARSLGMSHRGVTRVRVTVLDKKVARR